MCTVCAITPNPNRQIASQVTDLIWLRRYHGPLVEFGNGKYLIVSLLVLVGDISRSFVLAMGFLARLRLAKKRTMAKPKPPRGTKKKRLGITRKRLNL